MNESLWEKNKDRVHHVQIFRTIQVQGLLQLRVSVAKEFKQHGVVELPDDGEMLITVTKKIRVAELPEAGVLDPAVQEAEVDLL